MLRLLAGLVAAFIVGGLAAMPFTASSVAAQDETSDEDTVCCDATAQYDTLQFATRADCRRRSGVVVEDTKCEPEKEIVCCDATAQYDALEFATRAGCRSKNGVVVANNKCQSGDDQVCCDQSVAYGPTEFTTREACKNNGKVVANNRCEPESDDQPRVSGQIGGVALPETIDQGQTYTPTLPRSGHLYAALNVTQTSTPELVELIGSGVGPRFLLVDDFTGDGVSDIFKAENGGWYISASGKSPWEKLRDNLDIGGYGESLGSVETLLSGDLDCDGIADIIRLRENQVLYSRDGRSQYYVYGVIPRNEEALEKGIYHQVSEITVIDVDGDGCDDVIYRDHGEHEDYWDYGGKVTSPELERFRLITAAGPHKDLGEPTDEIDQVLDQGLQYVAFTGQYNAAPRHVWLRPPGGLSGPAYLYVYVEASGELMQCIPAGMGVETSSADTMECSPAGIKVIDEETGNWVLHQPLDIKYLEDENKSHKYIFYRTQLGDEPRPILVGTLLTGSSYYLQLGLGVQGSSISDIDVGDFDGDGVRDDILLRR